MERILVDASRRRCLVPIQNQVLDKLDIFERLLLSTRLPVIIARHSSFNELTAASCAVAYSARLLAPPVNKN